MPSPTSCSKLSAAVEQLAGDEKRDEHDDSEDKSAARQLHRAREDESAGATARHAGTEEQDETAEKGPERPLAPILTPVLSPVTREELPAELLAG